MVKFGYLFLNNGTWDGEQIVPNSWVNQSVQTVSMLSANHGYGFQWHTMPDQDVYYTAGMYGQYIFVSPAHDIVAGFTSGYGVSDIDWNPSMFRDYILGAVQDSSGIDNLTIAIVIGVSAVAAVLVLVYFWTHRRTK